MNRPESNRQGASSGHPSYQSCGGGQSSARYDDLEFPFCEDANKYEKLAKIGQGTFGYNIFFNYSDYN